MDKLKGRGHSKQESSLGKDGLLGLRPHGNSRAGTDDFSLGGESGK